MLLLGWFVVHPVEALVCAGKTDTVPGAPYRFSNCKCTRATSPM
jgi:hypothetical protein